MKLVIALAAIWLCCAPVAAQGQTVLDRFELFNECRPSQIVVESLSADAKNIGLTKERLRLAAESRLRAARLYTDSREAASGAYLYVRVTVVGVAYAIEVNYKKRVFDLAGDVGGLATTWEVGSTGTHGNALGSAFIMQYVSEHLDQFLANYLKVNEPACGGL